MLKLSKLLFEEKLIVEGEDEAGDIFGGGDEAAEEEGGEEEGEEEADEGDDAGEEAPAEEGAEEGDKEGAEEEKPSGQVSFPEPDLSKLEPEERVVLTKDVDDEISNLFLDFEKQAVASQVAQSQNLSVAAESAKYADALKSYLFEGEDAPENAPALDIHKFTADIARLAKNYQSLLDMESLIVNKAKYFLLGKYGEEKVEDFEEILDLEHGISTKEKDEFSSGAPEAPYPPLAVGATNAMKA